MAKVELNNGSYNISDIAKIMIRTTDKYIVCFKNYHIGKEKAQEKDKDNYSIENLIINDKLPEEVKHSFTPALAFDTKININLDRDLNLIQISYIIDYDDYYYDEVYIEIYNRDYNKIYKINSVLSTMINNINNFDNRKKDVNLLEQFRAYSYYLEYLNKYGSEEEAFLYYLRNLISYENNSLYVKNNLHKTTNEIDLEEKKERQLEIEKERDKRRAEIEYRKRFTESPKRKSYKRKEKDIKEEEEEEENKFPFEVIYKDTY